MNPGPKDQLASKFDVKLGRTMGLTEVDFNMEK